MNGNGSTTFSSENFTMIVPKIDIANAEEPVDFIFINIHYVSRI